MFDLKNLNIALIGAGWLGSPLLQTLNQLGAKTTSVRSATFDVKKDDSRRFLGFDILIYTVPPLGENEVETFFDPLERNSKIIFISSTSVYGSVQGPCVESSALFPESRTGKLLKESEEYLRTRFKKATIIRPGGLIGPDRHPLKYLAGKKDLKNGEEFLHLVHRDDIIKAIIKIIELDQWGTTFNLVNDLRIKKVQYYTEKAITLGLVPPEYTIPEVPLSNPTIISNEYSKNLLSIDYINTL